VLKKPKNDFRAKTRSTVLFLISARVLTGMNRGYRLVHSYEEEDAKQRTASLTIASLTKKHEINAEGIGNDRILVITIAKRSLTAGRTLDAAKKTVKAIKGVLPAGLRCRYAGNRLRIECKNANHLVAIWTLHQAIETARQQMKE
jgi:hypothetical protein